MNNGEDSHGDVESLDDITDIKHSARIRTCERLTKQKALVHKLSKISESSWFVNAQMPKVNQGWGEVARGWQPSKPGCGEVRRHHIKPHLKTCVSSSTNVIKRRPSISSHGDNCTANTPPLSYKINHTKSLPFIDPTTATFFKYYNASVIGQNYGTSTITAINQQAYKLHHEISLMKERQKMFLPYYLTYPPKTPPKTTDAQNHGCDACPDFKPPKTSSYVTQEIFANYLPYLPHAKSKCWSKEPTPMNVNHVKMEFSKLGMGFKKREEEKFLVLPANDANAFRKKLWRFKYYSFPTVKLSKLH